MIDFSECKVLTNSYGGADRKKTIIYESKKYMIKFSDNIDT
jgi:hypothetical protein